MESVKEDDILELDEMWSFVGSKDNPLWLWIALCRRTRQIVSYFIGDRGFWSCFHLYMNIPLEYRKCKSFSDFWECYEYIFDNHESVGKDSGETCHVERWNNTIRQRLARFTRKSLSFSKLKEIHQIVTHIFIVNYNLSVSI